jgi:hypothetical protein
MTSVAFLEKGLNLKHFQLEDGACKTTTVSMMLCILTHNRQKIRIAVPEEMEDYLHNFS